MPHIASEYPAFIEKHFAQGVYPPLSQGIGFVSSLFPFSLAEALVYTLLGGAVFLLVLKAFQLFMRKAIWVDFLSLLLSIAILFGLLLNLFYLTWGLNYFRPTLYTLMDLPVESHSVEDLEILCLSLSRQASKIRAGLAQDADGVFTLKGDLDDHLALMPAAYEALGKTHAFFAKSKVYPAKRVAASQGMSHAQISGIYIGITAEANVNQHQPDLLLLSAAAHENAHFLGIAREDEANFVSYLACTASDVPEIRYSGLMLALVNCSNRLYELDRQKHAVLRLSYSEAMRRDLAAHAAYWDQFEGKLEESVSDMNDAYLKHNGQESGVSSYGMMVDLLLAYSSKY